MKNKYILLTLIIIICFSLLFISCSNEKPLKPDTPVNTAMVMGNFLKAGNYESFNNMFIDSRKNTVSVEQFHELNKLPSASTNFKHYELLTFTNGKMLLVTLTQDKIDGEYKIQDIKEVPEEMKSLFK